MPCRNSFSLVWPCGRCLWLCGLLSLLAASPLAVNVPAASHLAAAENWPAFRNAGDSHTAAKELPWSWELRGRREGNWSIRLPGYGQSSPVVFGGRVFVTSVSGEEKEHLHVLAVSLSDGKTEWRRDLEGTQRVKDSDAVSRGAPTPVADAERIYVVFESGDACAFTHSGELVWKRSFVADYGEIKGPHGYASSPLLIGDTLVLQVAHAGPSYVLALDAATGKNRWRANHPSQTGWSSPIAVNHGESTLIVVSSAGSVRAFDAKTGQEVWAFTEIAGNSTASPTLAGELLLIGASADRGGGGRRAPPGGENAPPAAAPAAETSAGSAVLRLPKGGEAAEPKLAWRSSKVQAGYASPVALDGLAYFVNRAGVLQCVDLASGETCYTHRLPGEVWATPVVNGGHITFFGKHGAVVTLQGGRELKEVAESQFSTTDVVYGVAAVDGCWIVRTGRGLARIGGP